MERPHSMERCQGMERHQVMERWQVIERCLGMGMSSGYGKGIRVWEGIRVCVKVVRLQGSGACPRNQVSSCLNCQVQGLGKSLDAGNTIILTWFYPDIHFFTISLYHYICQPLLLYVQIGNI